MSKFPNLANEIATLDRVLSAAEVTASERAAMCEDYDVTCYSGTVRKQSQLSGAFNMVAPASHWKNPIDSFVPRDTDLNLIADAIIHFTGSLPNLQLVTRTIGLGAAWRVTAAGYYATCGA